MDLNGIIIETNVLLRRIFLMKSTGLVRKIDENGRIVLPKDIRDKMGIDEGDALEFFYDNDNLIIKKYSHYCIFCGNEEDVVQFKGKDVCKGCVKIISITF